MNEQVKNNIMEYKQKYLQKLTDAQVPEKLEKQLEEMDWTCHPRRSNSGRYSTFIWTSTWQQGCRPLHTPAQWKSTRRSQCFKDSRSLGSAERNTPQRCRPNCSNNGFSISIPPSVLSL